MSIVTRVTRQVQVPVGGAYDLGYHVVCCPKYRHRFLCGCAASRSEELIRVKAAGHRSRIVALGIMPGHVHLFVKAHPYHAPSPIASQCKGLSSWRLGTDSRRLRSGLPVRCSKRCFSPTVGMVPIQTGRRCVGTLDERPWRKNRAQ